MTDMNHSMNTQTALSTEMINIMGIANITTISYCVVKDDKFYEGSKEEIVSQVCRFAVTDKALKFQFHGYNPNSSDIIFSGEWTPEEMQKQAIDYIFDTMKKLGFRIYRNIGH